MHTLLFPFLLHLSFIKDSRLHCKIEDFKIYKFTLKFTNLPSNLQIYPKIYKFTSIIYQRISSVAK